MHTLTLNEARRLWAAAQGLDARASESFASTLARTGWIRTLGGTSAYVGLAARNDAVTVEAVNRASSDEEIRVSPAVRGCIYLIPAAHAGLAIGVAERLAAKRLGRDIEKAGSSLDEVDALGPAVLEALASGPATTRALAKALGDAVRSLGATGKKVGLTTTLPPALRRLEFRGEIQRVPADQRLDHEKYDWCVPSGPIEGLGRPEDELFAELARCYFRWAGPATRKEFAAWTGLNQTQAKNAIAACAFAEVEVEGRGACYVHAEALEAMPNAVDRLALLPAMDTWYGVRDVAEPLLRESEYGVELVPFGPGKLVKLREISQPLSRTMVCEGRVAGVWDIDPETGAFVQVRFGPWPARAEAELVAAQAEVEAIVKATGHAKVFSIDSDKRAAKRVAHLRALGGR